MSPLTCPPDAPPITGSTSDQAARTVEALVDAVQTLPGARQDRIALFGHSRGGGAAWNHVLRDGTVQALVLNSAGYPPALIKEANQFDAPVLILHGAADSLADGGSIMTDPAS